MKYILMLNPEESNSILINYDFIEKVVENTFDSREFEVEIVKHEESIYSHIFSFKEDYFEIFLNKKMDSISLEGDWEKIKNFVVSFINQLPVNQKIYFFDDSYNDNMVIDSTTTREDIESVFFY